MCGGCGQYEVGMVNVPGDQGLRGEPQLEVGVVEYM